PRFIFSVFVLFGIGAIILIFIFFFRSSYFLKKGNDNYKKGNIKLSIIYYKKYLKYKPKNMKISMRLAEIYNEQKLYKEGILLYQKIIKNNPDNITNFMCLGELQRKQGLTKEAINTYEKLFKKNLSSTDRFNIRYTLAELYYEQGKIQEAINSFQISKVLNNKDPNPYLKLAKIYKEQGNIEASFEEYERVQFIDPSMMETITNNLEEILEQKSNDINIIIKIAEIYKNFDNFNRSFELYHKASEIFPSANIYMNIAKLYLLKKDYVSVINEFKKAYDIDNSILEKILEEYIDILRKDSTNSIIRKSLAENYFKKGEINKAIFELNKLAEIPEFKNESFLLLGKIYLQKGLIDETFQSLEKIDTKKLTESGILEEIYYQLALLCNKNQITEKSIKAYAKIKEINGNYKDINNRLEEFKKNQINQVYEINNQSVILAKEGKFDEAIELCEKVLKLDPFFISAHRNLGFIYMQKNQLEDAINKFKQIIKLDPTDEKSYYSLALAYVKSKKKEEVNIVLNEMHHLFPQSQYLNKLENYLETL
ncbi:MAG: tetratricopeptide repeat protein, partial [bacterium]